MARQEQKEEGREKERMIREVKLEDPIGEVFNTEAPGGNTDGEEEEAQEMKRKRKAKALEKKILLKNRKKKKKDRGAKK